MCRLKNRVLRWFSGEDQSPTKSRSSKNEEVLRGGRLRWLTPADKPRTKSKSFKLSSPENKAEPVRAERKYAVRAERKYAVRRVVASDREGSLPPEIFQTREIFFGF
ncbi:hypothetical protein NL676_034316 [Syzygium grande]|nr:hypothetical protein NL676_034316 [Syzygium grande]